MGYHGPFVEHFAGFAAASVQCRFDCKDHARLQLAAMAALLLVQWKVVSTNRRANTLSVGIESVSYIA
jgi:hypothetical protein